MASVTVDRGSGSIRAGGVSYRWTMYGEAYSANCLSGDRSLALCANESALLCVFDGACGQPLDRAASSAAVEAAIEAGAKSLLASDLIHLMRAIDGAISFRTRGQGASTATLLLCDQSGLWVAAVGDSEVWGLRGPDLVHLSAECSTGKIGSGCPKNLVVSGPFVGLDVIVAGSDGLWNDLWPETACSAAKRGTGGAALVRKIRDKRTSPMLPDDVTVIALVAE